MSKVQCILTSKFKDGSIAISIRVESFVLCTQSACEQIRGFARKARLLEKSDSSCFLRIISSLLLTLGLVSQCCYATERLYSSEWRYRHISSSHANLNLCSSLITQKGERLLKVCGGTLSVTAKLFCTFAQLFPTFVRFSFSNCTVNQLQNRSQDSLDSKDVN